MSQLLPDRDHFLVGALLGLLIPVLTYAALTLLYYVLERYGLVSTEGFSPMFRERTVSIVAISVNAILLNAYNKKRSHRTARGIVLPTFMLVVVWLILFGDIVLGR